MTGPSPEIRAMSAARRSAAVDVLRGLTRGQHTLSDLLNADATAEQRDLIARTTLQRLLRAVPGVGPGTIMRICRAAEIDRVTRVGELSDERRQKLADAAAREVDLSSYSGSGPRKRAS